MPLADVEVGRESSEHRVATGRRGQEHLADPELGLHPPVTGGAEGRREQLSAETDAKVRHAGEHGLADRLLLGRDPRMPVMVPNVRRGAHDHEQVVTAPVRNRLTLVDPHTLDLDPAAVQHIAVDADRIRTQVFERECPHGATPESRANHTATAAL